MVTENNVVVVLTMNLILTGNKGIVCLRVVTGARNSYHGQYINVGIQVR